jgi:hypothetical protein
MIKQVTLDMQAHSNYTQLFSIINVQHISLLFFLHLFENMIRLMLIKSYIIQQMIISPMVKYSFGTNLSSQIVICLRYGIENHNSLSTIINLLVFVISRWFDWRHSSLDNDNLIGVPFGPVYESCLDRELRFLGGVSFRRWDITAPLCEK